MAYTEQDFYRYQEYLASKRANFAPSFGATILASTVALGIVEVAQPSTEYHEKSFSNTYSPRIGAIALENQFGPKSNSFELTPRTAARGQSEQLAQVA